MFLRPDCRRLGSRLMETVQIKDMIWKENYHKTLLKCTIPSAYHFILLYSGWHNKDTITHSLQKCIYFRKGRNCSKCEVDKDGGRTQTHWLRTQRTAIDPFFLATLCFYIHLALLFLSLPLSGQSLATLRDSRDCVTGRVPWILVSI